MAVPAGWRRWSGGVVPGRAVTISPPGHREPSDWFGLVDPRANALNAIRLVLAILVIVYHSPTVAGFRQLPALGDVDLGLVAVAGFFTISGYLIAASRRKRPFLGYVAARVRRIFPAYWVCLALTAFVAAPLAAVVRGGWSFPAATGYVLRGAPLGRLQEVIGGTLEGSPYPYSWNGSLWTLKFEFLCYIVIGIMLGTARLRSPYALAALLAVSIVPSADSRTAALLAGHPEFELLARLLPFFLAGAFLQSLGTRVRPDGWLAAVSAAAVVGGCVAHVAITFLALPLAYVVLWLGGALPAVVRKVGARNDLSYGVYIYAFPIQQLLVVAGAARWGFVAFSVLSIVATLPFAVASWFLVERPALGRRSERPFTVHSGLPDGQRIP